MFIASLNRLMAKLDTTGSADKRNGMVVVVVVVFIFQYGNIHLHTSGSIFINKYIVEKKKLFERMKSHTKTNLK